MIEQLVGKTVLKVDMNEHGFILHFEDGFHLIGVATSCGTCHVMRDGKLVPLLDALEDDDSPNV